MLSLRARSAGLTAAQVELARLEAHTVAWTWCQRGTLHMVSAADARWLIPLLGPELIASDRRRLFELGWDEHSTQVGLRLLYESVQERGELARSQIVRLLQKNNLPYEGQAPVHLLFRAALEGRLLRGRRLGREEVYVPFEPWLGELQPLPRPDALARLAEHYLTAYAPAAPVDLTRWSGLKIGEARLAFQIISNQLVEVKTANQPAWMLKSQLAWLGETLDINPVVRLLPRFDTYLLGYANRDLVIDQQYAPHIFVGGIIKPALLIDGWVCGTWSLEKRKQCLEMRVEAFEALDDALTLSIEAEMADIERYLGERPAIY